MTKARKRADLYQYTVTWGRRGTSYTRTRVLYNKDKSLRLKRTLEEEGFDVSWFPEPRWKR